MKPVTVISVFISLLLSLSSLSGCKDFIDPDITDSELQLQAPADQFQSKSYTIGFWWEEVDDALTYRLQVVTPGFDSPAGLVADTLVKGHTFSLNLSPGEYAWRMRAENGSTRTTWSASREFSVLFSSIKQQKVPLAAPANNAQTTTGNTTFRWGSLYGAIQYRLQVDTNNFSSNGKVVYEQVTPALQSSFTLPKDQNYQWRVRAENDTAQAQWSAVHVLSYDHTPPAIVGLTAPQANQTVSLPVSLQWNASATATQYKLYVYRSDMVTPYSNTFPLLLNTRTYSFNTGTFGEQVYWTVTAIDAAGNESTSAPLRSFNLQ
ncbi:hypothetical protein [Mucilaginibacter sp. PAMB04168]|uniref:hypothetical protein n=1 Tax=Mucilaginibacter sp. PAMB04168 TaxID=3138567 RepID=UPI0031F6F275